MTAQTPIPEGYRKRSDGSLVPETQIKAQDILEDELVRKLALHARAISEQLSALRALCAAEAQSFKAIIAEEYGATKGGADGNMTLRSFDGALVFRVAVSKHITFGPELMAAKELVDNCLTRWGATADDRIKTLITDAFQVDKQGKVDRDRLIALTKYDFGDEEWERAMSALKDAQRSVGSKTYYRFYDVDAESGREHAITLDLANA